MSKVIEIKGSEKAYMWRSDIGQNKSFTLQYKRISDLGPPGQLRSLIPNCMSLFLERNFLYSWDQFFLITSQIPNLRTLALSGNRLRKIDRTYFDGKDIQSMIPAVLKELVLIDMGLDWRTIDILSPTFINVEELFLVKNKCSKICSEYSISKDNFKSLKSLNLEENGIQSWAELDGFRVLKEFNKLILNKNQIPSIW
jgi:Leucine-rich repeat (LRR) protein